MDVTLWPIELTSVVTSVMHPISPGASSRPRAAKGLRIGLRAGGGLKFDQLGLDRLCLHFAGPDDVAFRPATNWPGLATRQPSWSVATRVPCRR